MGVSERPRKLEVYWRELNLGQQSLAVRSMNGSGYLICRDNTEGERI